MKEKGGAPAETDAIRAKSGVGSGSLESPKEIIAEKRFISCDSVIFKEELYPREQSSLEIIERYRLNIDDLPPIVVNQDIILIDGFHRLAAHRQEGKSEICAEIMEIPENQILIWSARLNAKHGKQLTKSEKEHLSELWMDTLSDEETADILGVTRQTVTNWRARVRRPQQLQEWKERQERNQKIVELIEEGHTQEQIAEEVGLSQSTISDIIQNIGEAKICLTDNQNKEIPIPDPLKVFNVWFFPHIQGHVQARTHRFGIAYPEIVEHLLHYFTEIDWLVVDPMAGTGTTKEVCDRYSRRCLMYDIAPVSSDIQQNNLLDGLPEEVNDCDFIYLEPPYYNNVVDDAFADLDEFYEFIRRVAEVSFETVRLGGIVAFVMADGHKHRFIPLIDECYRIFIDLGFECISRISSPLPPPHGMHTAPMVAKAKQEKRLLYRDRVVHVYRRPDP